MRVRPVLIAGTSLAAALAVLAGTLPAQGAPTARTTTGVSASGIAGIESVGPIPTIAAGGPAQPQLPDTVARVPGGVARHGEFPWLKVAALESGAQSGDVPERVTTRVYDISVGRGDQAADSDTDFTWQGDLVRGWGQVNERLTAGHGYVVWARVDGQWVSLGTFGVRGAPELLGATISSGALTVSTSSGEVSWAWQSERLAGPSSGIGATLRWQAYQDAMPGLPRGWRLMAETGSPWMLIDEGGVTERPHITPPSPMAQMRPPTRLSTAEPESTETVEAPDAELRAAKPKTRTAIVSFRYDLTDRERPRGFILEQRVKKQWVQVKRVPARFARGNVNTQVRVLKGATRMRVGMILDDVTLYSRSSKIWAASVTPPPQSGREPQLNECGAAASTLRGPSSVVLRGWNGRTLTFLRNATGVYEQTVGGDSIAGYRSTLSLCEGANGQRRWTFIDPSGISTHFEGGRAVSVTDSGAPVSTMSWEGERLASVTNGVGRTMTLGYADSASCPSWRGFASAPSGALCRIDYPGGVSTEIGYVSDRLDEAQIALIKDPGNTGTALGWDTAGRLTATRSGIANRAATTDPAAASAIAVVEYDTRGRAASLTEPPSSSQGRGTTTTIDYASFDEAALREGTAVTSTIRADAPGFAMGNRITIDPISWEARRYSDFAGLEVSSSARNDTVTQVDSRGLATNSTYDEMGNLVRQVGPVSEGSNGGTRTTVDYDLVEEFGREQNYSGFRATSYTGNDFTGGARAEFWQPRGNNGLSVDADAGVGSAIAQARWTPPKDADDIAADSGWTFAIDQSPGVDARVVIEDVPCEGQVCTIRDLPKGAKYVRIELASVPSAGGWVSVRVGTDPNKLTPVDTTSVVPGFNNRTRVRSNDVYSGSESQPTTTMEYANPETAQPSRVISPGGLTSQLGYEPMNPSAGQWGRVSSFTTPGGAVQRTEYWPNSGTASLPAPCTGTAHSSGQIKTITRTDGLAVTSYYDERGQVLATQTIGVGGDRQTVCTQYHADGSPRLSSVYDTDGALIETVETTQGFGGNPLTTRRTVTVGDAAPVSAGSTVSTQITVDWTGRPVRYVDESGTITTTAYTATGDASRVSVTPPGGNAPILTFDYSYRDSDGAPERVRVNGVEAARVIYTPERATADGIVYGNSVNVGLRYAINGRPDGLFVKAGQLDLAQTVTMTSFGRVEGMATQGMNSDGASVSESRAYTYDTIGRLTSARVTTGTGSEERRDAFDYAFGARQDASCSGGFAGAGLNGLRTGGARSGATYVSCYDSLGRPASTTDPLVTGGEGSAGITVDGLGRVTRVEGDRPLSLTWGAGTHLGEIEEGTAADYVRTTMGMYAGRLVDKSVVTPMDSSSVRYAYATESSGDPVLTLATTAGRVDGVQTITYPLPGGARIEAVAGEVPTLVLSGLDGAVLARISVPALAVNGLSGNIESDSGFAPRFGPYGEPLVTPSITPDSADPVFSWRAAQRHETLEGTSAITLMGLRPYLPALGIFLAPDPDSDAGSNMYSFSPGDPINGVDRTGAANEWSWFWMAVTAVLVVATIAVDVVTFGMAAPATGAGLGAWMGYLAITWGVPMALGYLGGKALEQSLKSQTEPSAAMDSFRSAVSWTQLTAGLVMLSILAVTIVRGVVRGAVWAGKKLVSWWRGAPAARATVAAEEIASRSLSGAVRSSIASADLGSGAVGNGGRATLTASMGHLSSPLDILDIRGVRPLSTPVGSSQFAGAGL